ncbi:glycosyltransferase [Bosea sp. 124]|uniref:glycosyltransferase n=1 Tax=Bosea sp. 124 TaxID=2135642 RepID=UPI000D3671CA|nr:glycosyltransferase [Bosea sp. 124]PTM41749.1 glycosyl transferase family 2 [Bosea sp. 124]
MKLSAIICSHEPRPDYLEATLASIRAQTGLSKDCCWELLLIDNGSRTPLAGKFDVTWHSRARIIREERLGLTFARLRGFHESTGEVLVYIDDDNILKQDYFAQVLSLFSAHEGYGAIGGKSLPVYEVEPPRWFAETGISLACRDLGDQPIVAEWTRAGEHQRDYPGCAPIGAGMAVRRAAYAGYVHAAANDPRRTSLGRRGTDLASGEDNDMILSVLEQSWQVAYRPELILQHLIPARRLTQPYLEAYARSSNRTWVQVLDVHGMRPWSPIAPWTAPLRKLRAALRARPWYSPPASIRWHGSAGLIEGRAQLSRSA